MRNVRRIATIALFVTAMVLPGCNPDGTDDPVSINLGGTAQMRLKMEISPHLGIDSGTVTISKGELEYSQPLVFEDNVATVLFEDLQPGLWQIGVELRDEDGYVLYAGSGEAEVVGNQTSTATIVVEELSGGLEVIIELPPDGTDGLIAYYPFTGSADDHSGNGHDGEVFGAELTSDRFGNPNSAYMFDGIDDFIHINDIEPFMLTSWTIVAWFKTMDLAQDQAIVFKMEDPFDDRNNFSTHVSTIEGIPGRVLADYETCESDANFPLFSSPIESESWHFMVYTRNQDTGEDKLYLNDLGVVDSDVRIGSPCANAQPVRIGISSNPNWEFFGAIDDVRIYDRALSATEVEDLYNESPDGELTLRIVSDASWRVSGTLVSGWETIAFDDSAWEFTVAPPPGSCGTEHCWDDPDVITMWSNVQHETIYLRRSFSLESNATVIAATIKSGADDDHDLYINGVLVASNWDGGCDPEGDMTTDIREYVQPGTNVIAIEACDSAGGCRVMCVDATIQSELD